MLGQYAEIDTEFSLGLTAILYLLGVSYLLSTPKKVRTFEIQIFTLALLVRSGFAFVLYFLLLEWGGDGYVAIDDRRYNAHAILQSNKLAIGLDGYVSYGQGWANIAYFNFGAFLYHHFQFDTMAMRMLNAFFGAGTAILGYRVATELFGQQAGRISAVLLALLPNLVFWSGAHVKDPLIIFCMMIATYILVCKFRTRLNPVSLLVLFCVLFLLFHLRKSFAVPFVGIITMWAVFRYTKVGRFFNNPRKPTFVKIGFMFLLSLPLLFYAQGTTSGEELGQTVTTFNKVQENLAESGGGFSRYLRIVDVGDFYKIPLAMAFTSIAPLPNFSSSGSPELLGSVVYSFMNIPLILLTPLMFVGLMTLKGSNYTFTDDVIVRWMPVLLWASISLIYLGVLRYKVVLVPYFVVWIAYALSNRRQYRRSIRAIYGCAIAGLLIILPIAAIFR